MRIEQGNCDLMDIEIQTGELQAYEYQVAKSGHVKMNAPEGQHDDCVWSGAGVLGLQIAGALGMGLVAGDGRRAHGRITAFHYIRTLRKSHIHSVYLFAA